MAVRSETPRCILDTHALLVFLEGGTGAGRVRELLDQAKAQQAHLSTTILNLGEVISVVERECGLSVAQAALARLWDLPITRFEMSEALGLAAARYQMKLRVELTDACAVALAWQVGGTLVTGNPELRGLAGSVTLEWLGEGSAA